MGERSRVCKVEGRESEEGGLSYVIVERVCRG